MADETAQTTPGESEFSAAVHDGRNETTTTTTTTHVSSPFENEENPIVQAIKVAVDRAVAEARKHDEENAVEMAKAVVKADKLAQKLKKVVGALVVIVVCLGVTSGLVVNKQLTHPLTNAIQRNQINSCEAANIRLKADTGLWQSYIQLGNDENKKTSVQLAELISVLAHKDPAEIAQIKAILQSSGKVNTSEQQAFLEKVAGVNKVKDCVAAYNLNGSRPHAIGYLFTPAATVAVPVARG